MFFLFFKNILFSPTLDFFLTRNRGIAIIIIVIIDQNTIVNGVSPLLILIFLNTLDKASKQAERIINNALWSISSLLKILKSETMKDAIKKQNMPTYFRKLKLEPNKIKENNSTNMGEVFKSIETTETSDVLMPL